MTNLAPIIPEAELEIKGSVVTITLLCSDAYAARVLYDDLGARIKSGLTLRLRGEVVEEDGPSA